MLKNNYHTHAKYCKHGEGDISEYVDVAISAGFSELGFTCHIPFEPAFCQSDLFQDIMKKAPKKVEEGRLSRMLFTEIDDYLKDIKKCQDKYIKDIKIYSGFECEYDYTNVAFLKNIKKKVDYLNLGIHHVFKGDTLYDFTKGLVITPSMVRDLTYDDLDIYAESCVNGMKSGLFNILVHPDFFMEEFIEFNKKCEEISRVIIEASIEYNVYLEINLSDYWKSEKKNRRLKYPRYEFWKIVSEYQNVKLLYGSDAHIPQRVNESHVYNANKDITEKLNLLIQDKMIINQ